jgi:hypothetical protein
LLAPWVPRHAPIHYFAGPPLDAQVTFDAVGAKDKTPPANCTVLASATKVDAFDTGVLTFKCTVTPNNETDNWGSFTFKAEKGADPW